MGTAITIAILMGLMVLLVVYEKKRFSPKELALVATLGAFAGVSRIPFAALPNIQPTTFIVILSGVVFGPLYGFAVGAIATVVSNSVLGHGIQTLWQITAWGVIGGLSGILFYGKKRPKPLTLAVYGFLCGFLFDYIMNAWHYLNFVVPHTWKTFVASYSASFFYDLMHGISNSAFLLFLGSDFMTILSRYKRRLEGKGHEKI